ncbi:MAG: tRNA 2-selenouridine(34) synthase MnmH [Flavobacteriales bacterium]
MNTPIDKSEFIQFSQNPEYVIIDVRSEGEFQSGYLPTAINLPLLNNEQRHIVGITYKEQGQQAAVKKGFELVGNLFHEKLNLAKQYADNKRIVVYCWRGGMRSEIMRWVMDLGGLDVRIIAGGYNAVRKQFHSSFSRKYQFLKLTGPTACGKTDLLHALKEKNECVIDLEQLAHHKGSAFGGLGQPAQPTQEQFENNLAYQLSQIPNECSVWIENESRMIGTMRIPDAIFNQIQEAPSIELTRTQALRIQDVIHQYREFPITQLLEKTISVQKRMGPEQNKKAILSLVDGDWENWVKLLLEYYDKTYLFHDEKLNNEKRIAIVDSDDVAHIKSKVSEIIELKEQWQKKHIN